MEKIAKKYSIEINDFWCLINWYYSNIFLNKLIVFELLNVSFHNLERYHFLPICFFDLLLVCSAF